MNSKYLLVLAALFVAVACSKNTTEGEDTKDVVDLPAPPKRDLSDTTNVRPPYVITDSTKIVTTASGLKYYIVEKGNGNVPKKDQQVTAHYHGLLADGKVFDSSVNRGQPFSFKVGQNQVIAGWDEGFQLFPVGTKAILIVPAKLGYGEMERGNIPANSTLYFHVQLLGVN